MVRPLSASLTMLVSFFIVDLAHANGYDGYVDYIPYVPAPPNPIPTMSEYLLASMALVMAVAAFRFLRGRTGNTLASILAGLIVVGGLSETPLIGNADALPPTPILLNDQAGGSAPFYCSGSAQPVSNTTSVAQKITAIRYVNGDVFPPTPNPCVVDMVVPANTNNFCNVSVDCG